MPFLLENRPKTVKKISRGAAPDPLSLPISGRAPRQPGPPAEAQRQVTGTVSCVCFDTLTIPRAVQGLLLFLISYLLTSERERTDARRYRTNRRQTADGKRPARLSEAQGSRRG